MAFVVSHGVLACVHIIAFPCEDAIPKARPPLRRPSPHTPPKGKGKGKGKGKDKDNGKGKDKGKGKPRVVPVRLCMCCVHCMWLNVLDHA